MSFQKINQPLAVKLVQQWLAKQTNQPLLFYGPVGAGKRALALEAAKALNCGRQPSPGLRPPSPSAGRGYESPFSLLREKGLGDEGGCDTCLSCKKISSGKHPDVRVIDLDYQAVIRGEPLEKQQFLRIETLLDERRRLYQTAHEAAWKVSIIDEAHRMTADAANVLLKILEEPPPRTTILLLTPYRDRIFATLISRCQPVRFTNGGRGTGDAGEGILNKKILLPRPASHTPRPKDFTRADAEVQLTALLLSAADKLRRQPVPQNISAVELIQKAQQQLRQNVPPALVYDHLLQRIDAESKS